MRWWDNPKHLNVLLGSAIGGFLGRTASILDFGIGGLLLTAIGSVILSLIASWAAGMYDQPHKGE